MTHLDDDTLLAGWRLEKIAAGSTERSIHERTIVIRAMLRRTGKTLMTVQRQDLIADLARPGIAAATRQLYRGVMFNVFTWMQDEQHREDNPAARLPKVRVPQTEANPFTLEDVQKLLESGIYARTRMYVLLYAYQGFRAQEIAAVSTDTIDWDQRRILSKEGKAGKEVWRPIHPLVWEALQAYPRDSGYLFPSQYRPDQHVKAGNVATVLSRAIKRAGIRHNAHQMRAFFATEMIRAGASTVVVAGAMRHSDLQSITRYVAIDHDSIDTAMNLLPHVIVPAATNRGPRPATPRPELEPTA
ncbi:MAG: hypothetical protein DI573_13995 [Microbacterium sp.]|uniref:tyrosine-type recombinase/integrase n=1 Tax=Microbacterium sp. TaxID=51671 RepID=UPI000DB33757|nr:tyrosine-type recombinase/integrase [Microbacterium sp.]PZU36284.1 MAG: hypothetical protein DI573_13995 [Microbacterium sp.]